MKIDEKMGIYVGLVNPVAIFEPDESEGDTE